MPAAESDTIMSPLQTPLINVAEVGVMLTGPGKGIVKPKLRTPLVGMLENQSIEVLLSLWPKRAKLIRVPGSATEFPLHWEAGIVMGLVISDALAEAPAIKSMIWPNLSSSRTAIRTT